MSEDKWEKYKKDHCSKFDELVRKWEQERPEEMSRAQKWVLEALYPRVDLNADVTIELLDNPPEPTQALVDLLACDDETYLNWEEQDYEEGRVMYENGLEGLEELPKREKK